MPRNLRSFASLALFFCLTLFHARADVVLLKSGQVVSGSVIQQDEKGVLIKLDYGTFTYPNSLIKEVKRANLTMSESVQFQRIPDWGRILSVLAQRNWAFGITQIPATVIGLGPMRNVPYLSFRCDSGGYELNIYGEPDHPVGVELGVQKFRRDDYRARANCIEFMCSVFTNTTDVNLIRTLKTEKDLQRKEGITFEITPPSDPDAYGGWWVSAYDEKGLENARASESELKAITQPTTTVESTKNTSVTPSSWSTMELKDARPSSSSSGGTVYVRGYYRKDGTYVRSHTRRR